MCWYRLESDYQGIYSEKRLERSDKTCRRCNKSGKNVPENITLWNKKLTQRNTDLPALAIGMRAAGREDTEGH